MFCAIGVFSLSATFDVIMAVFDPGRLIFTIECEPAPILLGHPQPMMEIPAAGAAALKGDPMILLTRPIGAAMRSFAALIMVTVLVPALQEREEVFVEDD